MTPKTGGTTCSVLRVGGFLVTDDTIFQVGDIILRAAEHLGQKLSTAHRRRLGYWFSVLHIRTPRTPTTEMNARGEWIIWY